MSRTNRGLRGLYAVTPADNLLPRLSALVGLALEGGARLVQYRNKEAPMPLKRSQAAELLRICHAHDARLIVNDDVWLAIEIGADGVHLGRDDADPVMARQALGPKRLLGVSCYDDVERAVAAEAAGADYVAIGSMFPSATKPNATRAPLELITEIKRRVKVPVAAIGGIKLENAPAVLAAGADMVAVVSDLFDAMDIKGRAAAFQKLFDTK
ncbi:thiamine phosphate synthase [Sulfurisoma sediminicola]|uniref:Thiamine-phosphate synthase n=1 Tax=Sulfurisoma sediminicola TaxID=1381557 RepID=A0A497XKJ4_9PROT|nr:thiamine phosphate synthase [Sulfurisoma sediminicola]RLJ68404.1 thiamine-phosphate diphosphorylase [Sulfurisoma sediminicola]